MQHQTIIKLDTHPVILATLQNGFDFATDWPEGEQEIGHILSTHPGPLFLVSDIRGMTLSLDDLLAAASLGSRGQAPIWHHPKIRGVYFISDSTIIKMAAAGLNSPTFGNTKTRVFASVEEALADIEQAVATA